MNNILKYAAICSLGIALLISNQILQAQCSNTDASSNNPSDAWLSCETSSNPNTDRGTGHWLQYDLGYVYGLGTTTFWNYNVENEIGKGFKQVAIDYSLDGNTWTEAGEFQLEEASGTEDYPGVNGLDLSGINARYLLITALSTWNGGACAGLSEVRFQVSAPTGGCGDIEVIGPIGGNSISTGIHYSHNAIQANGIVKSSSDVVFQSAASIELQAGFEAKAGGVFEAKVENCPGEVAQNKRVELEERAEPIVQVEPNVRIFPNPAIQHLNIRSDVGLKELMIVNSAGHEVLRMPFSSSVDVSYLPDGMYFLRLVMVGGEVVIRRFIKQ